MNRIFDPVKLPMVPQLGDAGPAGKQGPLTLPNGPSFGEVFRKEINRGQGLRFSAHALDRLTSRGIQLSQDSLDRLTDAVDRAAEKGAQDALMLMPGASRGDDLALVVSVANRTVITAMDGNHIRESVFTNIDSAVVVS